MKKLFLLTVIAVLGLTFVNAQEVKFGVKAGVDFASIKNANPLFNIKSNETGFYVGGFTEIGISDVFSIQPEVLYTSVSSATGFNFDLDQINIPVMAKYKVSEKIDVLAGPAVGFLLEAPNSMKSFNFGIEAGGAFNITEALFVEARYNIGLANLLKNAPNGTTSRVSGFFVGMGYRFN